MLIDCYIKYVSGKINGIYFLEPIRTTEVTGALNQRLRPLGHAILRYRFVD